MEILEILKLHHNSIQARFHVRRLGVFGSHARREAKKGSDIDLLVEFAPGAATLDNFMELHDFLETLLGVKVELLTPYALTDPVRPEVTRETVWM